MIGIPKYLLLGVAVALALVWALPGCGKSGSGDGTSSAASGMESEAQNAAMAEIQKHWSKGADGWTTALKEGSGMAPISFLRQARELTVDRVIANDLSDADKMNGFEWAGEVWLKGTPAREVGENGIILGGNAGTIWRHPGGWSQWAQYDPLPLQVQKVKGQWEVHPDNTLVSGHIPRAGDLPK
jgi:hypothetical protein